MDRHPFDALTRVLHTAPSRRALIPLLGSGLAIPLGSPAPAEAKKKKKKKSTLCLDGQSIKASKKKKKKLLKSGATPGACPSSPPPPGCTPTCPGTTCGGDDGCGGTCGCAAGSICHGGLCRTCDLACTGDGNSCGTELQTFLTTPGTRYVCPGRYIGVFSLEADITLIGAGASNDPATSTILDANAGVRVLHVKNGVNATLHGLFIIGGNGEHSGGILNEGTLDLHTCTVDGNHVIFDGGGIRNNGPLTIDNCTISANTAAHGGGIYNLPGRTVTIKRSAITAGNSAGLHGGGIYNNAGTVILDAASTITGNVAGNDGGGIFNSGGTITTNGANISDNVPDDCKNC